MAKRHGLIEAFMSEVIVRVSAMLSVAKRHGLIEASASMSLILIGPSLSVAKRHGLIEAEHLDGQKAIACMVIRGKTPRPH